MPTDPALTAWIPPEGCDVLRPTVGGGQAPQIHLCDLYDDGVPRWELGSGGRLFRSTPHALLLAHDGTPVPAGMDAGRRVLAEALGVPGSHGVRFFEVGGLWRIMGVMGDTHHVRVEGAGIGVLYAPHALALALAHHVGGRAVFADASGAEVEP